MGCKTSSAFRVRKHSTTWPIRESRGNGNWFLQRNSATSTSFAGRSCVPRMTACPMKFGFAQVLVIVFVKWISFLPNNNVFGEHSLRFSRC